MPDAAIPPRETAAAAPERGAVVWLKRAVLVLVVGLAIWAVEKNYDALSGDLRRLPLWAVPAALGLNVVGMFTSLQLWRSLMRDFGADLPMGPAARIFFISQLGKYVPGSIWSVMGQMELGREYKVPRKTSVAIGVLVLVIAVAGGITVAVAMLPLLGGDVWHRYWWLVLTLPLLYAGLHPRVLGWSVDRLLALVRRAPIGTVPSWGGMLRALGLQVVVWILFGLQAWLLLVVLDAPVGPSLPAAVGGYALAYSLGMAAFVLPAGAGVREATLVVALSGVVPSTTALLIALIMRLVATVTDLGLAGVMLLGRQVRRRARALRETS